MKKKLQSNNSGMKPHRERAMEALCDAIFIVYQKYQKKR